MEILQDILAAIGVVLNGIPQGLLALTYGFASVPTAIGFAVGAVSCGALNSVAPISFQAETIVMAGSMGKTRRERLSMVMFGGLIMVVLGLTGALSAITSFAGDAIVHAMMAGVGFVLVRTAFGMVKENQIAGWVSVASAVLIYLVTKYLDPSNALVYTIVGSLIISSVAAKIAGQKLGENAVAEQMCRLRLEKPTMNLNVARGALSLACLTIGANIAFGNITSGMSGGEFRPCGRAELPLRRRPCGGHHLRDGRGPARGALRRHHDGGYGPDPLLRPAAEDRQVCAEPVHRGLPVYPGRVCDNPGRRRGGLCHRGSRRLRDRCRDHGGHRCV